MATYDEIMKGLDHIESPLIKQTVEYMLSKMDSADTDEEYDIAKSAFLMYLHSAAPQLLKEDVNVAGALAKCDTTPEPEVETIDAEALLKDILAEEGIYYFGPLSKHYLHDSRGQYDPHTDHQENHGNRPGKREIIGYIADLRDSAPPEEKDKYPRRKDMLQMSYEQLHNLGHKHLGVDVMSGDQKDIGEAVHLPARPAGTNSTQASRAKFLARIKRNK